MMVIQMSGQESTRLRIMIDLADRRITVEAAATLMGLLVQLERQRPASGMTGVLPMTTGFPASISPEFAVSGHTEAKCLIYRLFLLRQSLA
jgi:hypothetical protein